MRKALEYIKTELQGIYPPDELQNISFLIIEKLTGLSRSALLLNKSTIFSTDQRKELESFIEKLRKNAPIQYILGDTDFYGLLFTVDGSVLIPRPETEELIEWIARENDKDRPFKILDIGTGSGCIAVTLKRLFPNAEVDAFDVSDAALATAEGNAKRNDVSVNFRKVDILQPFPSGGQWDIIVSNPPYIPEREKKQMDRNVLDYEPSLALFVPDDDPLLFYRKIADFASSHLRPGGQLFFEIHYDAGPAVVDLLRRHCFDHVELRKDMGGNDRMVRGKVRNV